VETTLDLHGSLHPVMSHAGTVNGAGVSLARAPRSGKRLDIARRHPGKLDVLRVECAKCDRKGRYHVHKLIEKYRRMGNMMKWREMLNADCPKCDASQLHDRCDLVCPDLSKVLMVAAVQLRKIASLRWEPPNSDPTGALLRWRPTPLTPTAPKW
jgi:hypothetical protein